MLNYYSLVRSVSSFHASSDLGHGRRADLLHLELLLTIRRDHRSNAAINLDSLVLVSPGEHLRLSDNKLVLFVDAIEIILVRVLARSHNVVALTTRAAMMHLELLMTSS